MKNTLMFIVFVLVVLAFLFAISGEKAFRIPEDEYHTIINNNEVCMDCHGPGMPQARKETHPPKDDCIKCHKVKKTDKRLKKK